MKYLSKFKNVIVDVDVAFSPASHSHRRVQNSNEIFLIKNLIVS